MPYQSKFSSSRPRFGSSPTRSYGRAPARRGRMVKQNIHPSKFIRAAKMTEQAEYVPQHTFAEFALHPQIHKNVEARGYVSPSQIQDLTIAPALEGKDVIGIANTGTGKTAAFALPILTKLMHDKSARVLIIAPTRELAEQIETECRSFASKSGLCGALLIGGSSMGIQLRDLRANPNIVIGTPGRIKDHVERGTLKLKTFNIVVLDEVDRMLDMGFINDIRYLLDGLATVRQSLFFSATMEPKIESLIQSFSSDPVMISVKSGETSDSVEQDIVQYQSSHDKLDKLHNILIDEKVAKTLVFDETQRSVERLSKELEARGFKVDAIHGGKSQGQRQRALKQFRDNQIRVLVATDVAARGIDVSDITHVINYTTPNTYDDYVHRIGRAGRAGRKGYALTFVDRV